MVDFKSAAIFKGIFEKQKSTRNGKKNAESGALVTWPPRVYHAAIKHTVEACGVCGLLRRCESAPSASRASVMACDSEYRGCVFKRGAGKGGCGDGPLLRMADADRGGGSGGLRGWRPNYPRRDSPLGAATTFPLHGSRRTPLPRRSRPIAAVLGCRPGRLLSGDKQRCNTRQTFHRPTDFYGLRSSHATFLLLSAR
jgi:hypothetical protein